MQVQKLDLHVEPELLVERAERLVEQQDRRPRDQRAGERHPLALAAAQLMDPARVLVGEPDQRQGLPGALPALGRLDAAHLQTVLHVLADRHVREQRVVLEHGRAVAIGRRDAR